MCWSTCVSWRTFTDRSGDAISTPWAVLAWSRVTEVSQFTSSALRVTSTHAVVCACQVLTHTCTCHNIVHGTASNTVHSVNRLCLKHTLTDRLSYGLRPTRHKIRHDFGDIPQANLLAWYGKLNLTQWKYTFTNQKKRITTQNKCKKTKARFSRLLQHLAWKRRVTILVLAPHKFSLTYLDTYPLTYSPGPIRGTWSLTHITRIKYTSFEN